MRETFNWYGWLLRNDALYFESDDGELILRPTDLLIAIDETGIEDFSDPKYPVFGLGGCAVYAGLYLDVLCFPWMAIKKQYFGTADVQLHAAELHGERRRQMAAPIGEFFKRDGFFRLAALTTATTVTDGSIDPFVAVAMQLMTQVSAIQKFAPFERAVFVFEGSQRTNGTVARIFREFKMSIKDDAGIRDVEIIYLRATKDLLYPALEIADFVMHAAGNAVRAGQAGQRYLDRKDFAAVFGSAPEYLTQFLCLHKYGLRPNKS